jgi:C-terminal processing protease CtpA/Prc
MVMADEAGETGLVDSDPVSEDGTLQDALKSAVGIREFLDGRKDKQLTTDQCLTIVDEAIRLLDGLYVHLPLKRAMYAVDPIRRLRLLQYRLQQPQAPDTAAPSDDLWFHREMNAAFTSVRDLHTTYVLPEPFDRAIAFLPFQIEECFEENGTGGKERKFIIGNVVEGLGWFDAPRGFERGVEVTYWNGMQIERAVELSGERNPGSNPNARWARGLARLTIRPLAKSVPPDEEWVTVSYISALDQKSHTLKAPWRIAQLPAGQDPPPDGIMLRHAMGEGLDHEADMIRVLRGEMFGRKHPAARRTLRLRVGKSPPAVPEAKIKVLDPVRTASDFFQARTFVSDGIEYGHIRIRSFKQAHSDEVLAEFVDLLERMPPDGLVIDVRDNPGGYISTGERLLQTLTPKTITPEPMQFINTQTSLQFCTMFLEFEDWVESIRRGLETQATFSSSIPYSCPKLCNNVGQHYYGPVVLVTNALCYSTTDIFAAGFKDHGIGKVLGTDGSTGAGGANVMTLSALRRKFEGVRAAAELVGTPVPNWPLGEEPLPLNADLRVAIRRTLRVGKRSGMELEDLGVKPDVPYQMTRADVLAGNVDLLREAAELLRGMPRYVLKELTVQGGRHGDDPIVAKVQTSGIEWLDVNVDGWASDSQMTKEGKNPITARWKPGTVPQVLELCGYRMEKGEPSLVARRRIDMAKLAGG